MLDDLLKLVFRAVDVSPAYEPSRCIAVKRSRAACTACADACPHDAVAIPPSGRVEIDEVDCTGCGLCVRACPSQALDASASFEPEGSVRCSRVRTGRGRAGAQQVHCLGRLGPTDVLRLLGRRDAVALVRNDCASCPIGGAAVAEAVERVRGEALAIAAVAGREPRIDVVVTDELDADDLPERALSRRDLLRGGWRNVQRGAAEALAPLDPGDDEGEGGLPRELRLRYAALERAAPEPDASVPWVLPRVTDGCILCPVCTNVCPTGAFSRDFSPADAGPDGVGDGATAVLRLDPERCLGCDACVEACPTGAISMRDGIAWAELSGGAIDAHRSIPGRAGVEGSVAR